MRLEKKTTATLLIAMFMVSIFAISAYAVEGTHLLATGDPGTEDRIVVDMPTGFTLGDLKTISWSVYMEYGYPLHVDIILGTDIDGNDINIDSLTAEIGENDNPLNKEWVELQLGYEYQVWHKTFEYADRVGDSVVDDETVLWVTRHGAGCDDAPYGTLAELKAGTVHPGPSPDPTIIINENVVVLRLEFEIDNWLGSAEAYLQDIKINSKCEVSLETTVRSPMTSISVTPTSVDFGQTVLGKISTTQTVTIDNIGETHVMVTAELLEDDGFYASYLILSSPGVPSGPVSVWSHDYIGSGGSTGVDFKLIVSRNAEAGVHTAVLVFWAEEIF